MNEEQQRARPATQEHVGPTYQIRLQGHLDDRWSAWLGGLTVTHERDGTTLLYGALADQAALYGILIKLRDLSLPLVCVQRAERE